MGGSCGRRARLERGEAVVVVAGEEDDHYATVLVAEELRDMRRPTLLGSVMVVTPLACLEVGPKG
ncbi:hypothetical protein AMTR_s00086p00138590 [Amborella trichopoda]|uniref:Uncharacterized protein n=1 Tax=Amborella trichopoda TaxID=13333 RepID=W1NYZ4_AMBTC|nr:hypothetical protein AMTR_s00086p00138590 [Amborella trichopoda]